MGRMNAEDAKIYDPFFQKGFRFQSMDWVPASGDAISKDAPTLLLARPAGAINLKLPTSSADIKGLAFFIVNSSASAITLQTDGGAGLTNASVIAANQSGWIVCNGSATQAGAWHVHVSAATQTSP